MSPDHTRRIPAPSARTARFPPDDRAAMELEASDLRFVERLLACGSAVNSDKDTSSAPTCVEGSFPARLGDYDLLRLVGHGGMGLVFEARHRIHHHIVALKTMCYDDPAALVRLKREFRLLSDVVHPHLVTLYELQVDGPYCFFTMELIRGVHFLTHVGGQGGLPLDEMRLRTALAQLVDGVSALHRIGRLHRDIKPSNILVRENGQVVLIDFGLAVEMHAWRSQGSFDHLAGTLPYMAPERFRQSPSSPSSDWYSVGVVLYRALTGKLPFPTDDYRTLLGELEHDPPAPHTLNPNTPADLNALCIGLLRRDPSERLSERQIGQLLSLHGALVLTPPLAPPPLGPPQPAESFIGRTEVLAQMRAGLDFLGQGQPVLVLLEGHSGMGKTALLQRFLTEVRAQPGALVLSGRCFEQETVTFKAWDALMDALGRYLRNLDLVEIQSFIPLYARTLARVFPAFGQVAAFKTMPERGPLEQDQQELRRRATHALRELLCRLGNQRIVVLAVDDVHWGDTDSINLLEEILRPPDGPTLLFVGSYRSENKATSPFTRRLLDANKSLVASGRQISLVIEELAPAETEQLARELLKQAPAASEAQVAQVVRESGGHPLFAQMLVRHQLLGLHREDLAARPALEALERVLLDQFQTLPSPEQRLLEQVAIASGPLLPDLAWRAADIPPEVGQQAVHALRAGRWLRSEHYAGQDALETYHDRMREVIVKRLSLEEWRKCHQQMATVLERATPVESERLAVHWFSAGQLELAGGCFVAAADQARQALAFHRAAMLYQRGLDLLPAGEAQRLRLLEKAAEALALAGRGAEAAQAYLAAAELYEADALSLQQRAADQYLKSGHVDVGLEVFRTVLQRVGERMPKSIGWASVGLLLRRAQLWLRGLRFKQRPVAEVSAEELTRLDICWTVFAGLSLLDQVRAAYFQARGLLLALRVGEPFRVARALMSEAAHIAIAGVSAHRRVMTLFNEADQLVRQVNTPHARGLLHMTRGIAIFLEGRWYAAWKECAQAVDILQAECPGTLWEQVTSETFLFWSLTYMGEFAELRRRFPACWNDALARGDRYAELNYGTYSRTLLRLCEDDEPRGTEELRRLQGQWFQQGFHVQHLNCLWSQTKLDLYAGRGLTAWLHLETNARAVQRSFLLRIQVLRVYHQYLRGTAALAAAIQTPQPATLLKSVQQSIRSLTGEDASWARALARLLRAGFAALTEDRASVAGLYRAAAEELARAEMHHLVAAARFRQGQYSMPADGDSLRDQALSWMRQQAIVNPGRMINMYAPSTLG